MMKLLIDGCAFENFYQVGVQRYFRELLGGISRTEDVTLLIRGAPRAALPAGCSVVRSPDAIIGRPVDLFQSTRFTRSPLPNCPEVLTIHDMIPEVHWRYDDADVAKEVEAKKSAGDAALAIICATEATASDVRTVYPSWADKLHVVHYGADHLLATGRSAERPPKISRRFWKEWVLRRQNRKAAATLTTRPFVLFVGDRWGYKNFKVILEAMGLPGWDHNLDLAVIGKPFGQEEIESISRHHVLDRVHNLGRVSNERLNELYAISRCFVFPSSAEGFGFPLLEAQLAGAAVIGSDIPVFREIGGTSMQYCPPTEAAAWASAIGKIGGDHSTDAERSSARENARRFTWARCVERTLAVYREIHR